MSIPRSKYYYNSKKDNLGDAFILEKIMHIATAFPSYGYRRITAALKREGMTKGIKYKYIYFHLLNEGDAILIAQGEPHYSVNVGEKKSITAWSCAPYL